MPFKKVSSQVSFPQLEEEVLKYWEEHKIFERSVANREGAPKYSFNDGPPFATGTPHYGHIVGNILKDVVPRYFTMKGFQVERKWGWDCHGLPIENIAEKELGIKHKKDIEEMGVAKFNEFCRSKVLEYAAEWEKVIPRIGRWADMKNAYRTMDKEYMESVWWVFKELWDKGLIYESYRSMHVCPRCETTLSQQEVSEGYQDVKDLSVVAKFQLTDNSQQSAENEENTYVLAWTTTPWTLPGNVALVVGEDIEYVIAKIDTFPYEGVPFSNTNVCNGTYICSKKYFLDNVELYGPAFKLESNGSDLLRENEMSDDMDLSDCEYIKVVKGSELLGKSYKPLFEYYSKDTTLPNHERGWKIYAADFVTTEDGTGVVHIAPAFGEDDMNLGKEKELPFVQHVKMDGTFKDEVLDFSGLDVSPRAKGKVDEIREADLTIVKALKEKGLCFSSEKYSHSYPHCWRCDTPLLNYATSSWFVSVTKVKERALELAKDIHWSPEHIKEGRFGKWLEGARDWSISRQRYWASVMPVWKCAGQSTANSQQSTANAGCGEMKAVGSVAELEKLSGQRVDDLHKHVVDEITMPCEKCGGTMRRIPDVLDTWFDSGSMPYAQEHYPFENEEHFKRSFPADFIAEGVDQTRAWFYYQHVLGTAVRDSVAFKNVIVNGIVLAEDGKKMSKKLKNYPDPMAVVEKHGADALRLYLLSSPVVAAENLNFSERDLSEVTRNAFRMLWNSYSFFMTYASIDEWQPLSCHSREGGNPGSTDSLDPRVKPEDDRSSNLLDRWILSELQMLIKDLDRSMEAYEMSKAARLFTPFIDNLSNWYIRRSRDRFWKSEDDTDKAQAYQTLYDVLVTLSKLIAPFTPFIAEEIYRGLTGKESVHLADWPELDEKLIDEKLNEDMKRVRDLVTFGLKLRIDAKIEVKRPLALAMHNNNDFVQEMNEIIKEELNVKEILFSNTKPAEAGWLDGFTNTILNVRNDNLIGINIAKWLAIDTNITPELKLEWEMNKINRAIQDGRKKAGFNVEDRIVLGYQGKEKVFAKFGDEIAKKVLATEVKNEDLADAEYRGTVTIEEEAFSFSLKRV